MRVQAESSPNKAPFRGADGKMRYHWGDGIFITRIKLIVGCRLPEDPLCSKFERLTMSSSDNGGVQDVDLASDIDHSSDSQISDSASLNNLLGAADSEEDSEMSESSSSTSVIRP